MVSKKGTHKKILNKLVDIIRKTKPDFELIEHTYGRKCRPISEIDYLTYYENALLVNIFEVKSTYSDGQLEKASKQLISHEEIYLRKYFKKPFNKVNSYMAFRKHKGLFIPQLMKISSRIYRI